jgi:hypothetical protein
MSSSGWDRLKKDNSLYVGRSKYGKVHDGQCKEEYVHTAIICFHRVVDVHLYHIMLCANHGKLSAVSVVEIRLEK